MQKDNQKSDISKVDSNEINDATPSNNPIQQEIKQNNLNLDDDEDEDEFFDDFFDN